MAPLLYRLLIREMWKYLILIVALICLVIMNNHYYYYAFNLYRPSPEGSFRIMTYNTNGVSGEYEDSTFVEDFLLAVDSILPQVLALQEMREKYSPMLCEGLQQRFPYNSLVELEGSALKNKDAACLFSQFPIKSFFYTVYNRQELDSVYEVYDIASKARRYDEPPIYNAVLDVNGQETLVICCYLKTNDYSQLRNKHSDRWLDGLDEYFKGYNVGSGVRSLNAEMMRDSISRYDLPTIVCGDMNDFQYSRSVMALMGDDLKNVWWERGFGYGMTYNKYHLKIRIDHILMSKEIEAVSVDVPHLRFSDHYPIVADLKFCDDH